MKLKATNITPVSFLSYFEYRSIKVYLWLYFQFVKIFIGLKISTRNSASIRTQERNIQQYSNNQALGGNSQPLNCYGNIQPHSMYGNYMEYPAKN